MFYKNTILEAKSSPLNCYTTVGLILVKNFWYLIKMKCPETYLLWKFLKIAPEKGDHLFHPHDSIAA